MTRLIRFFVDHHVLTISLFGSLVLFGLVSALDLGIDLFPEIEIPVVAVSTPYAGAGPEEIARQVNEPIEGTLTTLPGIDSVTSIANEGLGFVIAQFSSDVDVDQAAIDVSQRVNAVVGELPGGAESPSVQKFDPNDEPILSVALTAAGDDLSEVQAYAEEELTPVLQRADGVADVTVVGPSSREVQVLMNPDRLQAYELTPGEVSAAIGASAVDLPAGSLTFGDTRVLLTGRGSPSTVAEVERIRVDPTRGVRVTDVATVRDTTAEVESYARLNGEGVVLMEVRKVSGSNAVATADNVEAVLDEFAMREGYQARIVGDATAFIEASVTDTLLEMVIAILAVSLIVLLFVGRLGTVFAVILAIPVSVAGAVVMFALLGFTFNIITLLAITVAIGLVVDDAIVVAESIDRYRELGYGLRDAVLEGAGQVSTAVLAATISLLAVFLPISFLPGIIGQFFAQFGLTLAAAIAFSYLEAMFFLTVRLALSPDPMPPGWRAVPRAGARARGDVRWGVGALRRVWFWLLVVAAGVALFAAYGPRALPLLLAVPVAMVAVRYLGRLTLNVLGAMALTLFRAGDWAVDTVRDAYVASLRRVLRRGWVVLVTVGLLFASLFLVFPRIGFNFQPPVDSGQIVIGLTLPAGTSLDRTNAVTGLIEDELRAHPLMETVQATVGSGGILTGSASAPEANVTAELVDKRAREGRTTASVVVELEQALRDTLAGTPEATLSVSAADSGAPAGGSGYTLPLVTNDLGLLQTRAEEALEVLEANPDLRNVESDLSRTASERVFHIDEARLEGTGLTKSDVFQALRAYNVGSEVAVLRHEGTEVPIRVKVHPRQLSDESALLSLPVQAPALGSGVPLSTLGRFETRQAPATINRIDQAFSAQLTADLAPGANLSDVQTEVRATLRERGILDERVTEATGTAFDLLGDLLFYGPIAFALALLLNYLAIGSQFNSFRYPIYLLLTVPLALIGVVWLFFLTGTSMDVISILGVVMLVGLVTKNAILLLDVALKRVGEPGVSLHDALLEAAHVRFRPIIMTTLTVVVISLPLLLGLGEGSELREPLGLVILGGVMTSALLTFYVVPAAFYVFERKTYQRGDEGGRVAAGTEPRGGSSGGVPAMNPSARTRET